MKTVRELKKWDIPALFKVSEILYKCGKDMAQKYNLHHWNNSRFKNLVIVGLCVLKNNIFIVYDDKKAVATFQTRKTKDSYLFQKLATSPDFAGGGIGSQCH